jgi:hypothetical protein
MKVKMSDEKSVEPTVIIATQQSPTTAAEPVKSGRLTRRHILWAVVSLIITGLVVTAVLVGIHLVTKGNEETLKMSLTLRGAGDTDVKQNVSLDNNANIVVYHVTQDGQDVTINSDFDKDIQVMKILDGATVVCFVTPLNRSNALDKSSLNLPHSTDSASVDTNSTAFIRLEYDVAPSAISDPSFLGTRANALCHNIPIYWLQPRCTGAESSPGVGGGSMGSRSRRSICQCSCTKQCQTCIKIFGRRICTPSYCCGYGCCCFSGSICASVSGCDACKALWDAAHCTTYGLC